LGVGTASPGYPLDVSGVINASTGYSIGTAAGYTGVIVIPGNPPGTQNINVVGGIITNVF
jgi:hypothetical protein